MKRLLRLLLCICVCYVVMFCVPVSAIDKNPPISVKINDNYILMDTEPVWTDNVLCVPLRSVVTALNAEILWDSETNKITINEGNNKIELSIGTNIAYVNEHEFELDVVPTLMNNRTMVPISFFAQSMACTVNYDEKFYTVGITREDIAVPTSSIFNRGYTDEDLVLLAKIVNVEVGYISFDAKIAVANIVINRRDNPQFPSTIEGVIYDSRYCVQFPPAHKASFAKKEPTTDCMIAAKMALEGVNNVDKCLYFNNRPFKSKSNDFYKKIDAEYFYY